MNDWGEPISSFDFDVTHVDSVKYSFMQLFDINEVQKIQDAFSAATGVASIITDPEGKPLTKPSGFSVFCNEIVRKTEKGLCNCMKSDATLGRPDTSGPIIQRCLSGGLLDGGASIMIGNHHIANWMIGQVFDEDSNTEEMYAYCNEIGADRNAFEDALKQVYRMPRERFESVCNFLYHNAKMLSSLAARNFIQKEEIAKRKQTEDKYRMLFRNSVDSIVVIQHGKLKLCSPAGVALTGYTLSELMTASVTSLVHPEDREYLFANHHANRYKYEYFIRNGNRSQFRIAKKDGTFVWVEMNTIRIRWEHIPSTLHFITNINQRKITEDALRLSEEKYRLLTESTSDVIWVMNLAKRKYTYISPSIWQLRGITAAEALQENLEDSFTPTSWVEASSFIDNYAAEFVNNPDSSISHVNEVMQPRKNGGVVWAEVSTRLRYNGDGEIEVVGVSRNIEKRKKADAKMRYISYSDLLTGLANRRFYEDELARIDTQEFLPITLIMIDVNGLKLTNDAFGHTSGDSLLVKVANIIRSTCGPEDTAARIGGDEFVLLLPKSDAKNAENRISLIKQAIAHEKVSGIILSVSIGYAVKTDISEDIRVVLRKADENMYKNKLGESPNMRSKTIELIMNTLYEKNSDEMLHSQRVSSLCEKLARQMNFNGIEINQIKLAGLMHDIGKIGIDERILNNPKMLTAHEWSELRRHSEISYRILSSVNEYAEVADCVLAHHERWDGKGYPKGLSHTEISIKSRIISVADSYDAMTSDHLYRKGLSKEEAVAEIIKCSGTQFDEDVARIFVEKVLEMPWK